MRLRPVTSYARPYASRPYRVCAYNIIFRTRGRARKSCARTSYRCPPAARLGLLAVYDDKLSKRARAYTITRKTRFNEKYKITETTRPWAASACACVRYWQWSAKTAVPAWRFPRCSRRVFVRCAHLTCARDAYTLCHVGPCVRVYVAGCAAHDSGSKRETSFGS